MTRDRFLRAVTIAAVSFLGLPAVMSAQSDDEKPAGFERRYIDAAERRHHVTMLGDWPTLTRLIRWSRDLESQIAEADRTISEDLLDGFDARVDTLRSEGPPMTLGLPPDTVGAILDSLEARLASARVALDSIPVEVRPTGGEADAGPERDRSLVTGETVVRVPAGIAVGDRDTLPTAEVVGEDGPNFVDWIAEALHELDRLVHLVRRADEIRASEDAPAATPSPDTGPRRPGP